MPSSSRHITWLSAAVIAVVVLVPYASALHTPFQYDDLSTVVENRSIRNLSDIRLALSPPPNEAPTSGRPLLNLSFAIDYAISGLGVVGYHATNIALHLACAFLLFAIVRRTATWPSVGLVAHADVIAAATATIWAVHPLHTGAVTYISGRSEPLMAVWYLTALLASIHAHRSPHASAWSVTAVFACAVGLACKESMVTAPVAILLYDRAYVYERFATALRERWRLYASLAATWLITAGLLLQAPHSESAGFATAISPWTYLLNQALVIPEYIRLVVWPDYLLFAYGEARQIALAEVGPIGVVAPALVVAAFWLWYRRPALGFPALWVFLTLAPTSSIVPIATEAGAARRMYLPLAGIVVLFVIAIVAIANVMRRRHMAAARPMPVAIASVIVVVLSAATTAQNLEFASPERLWRGSLERWPSALAHRNLAAVLLQQGRRAEAAEHLRAAADLKPLARYSLGVELFEQGRSSEAIVELRRAIQEFPGQPTIALEGRRVLGRALQKEGRHLDAAEVFAQIAAMTPDDVAPRLSRADELLAAGDLAGAHQEYQRVLATHPAHLGAMTNDGLTLLRLGRISEALPLLRVVAEQQPHNAGAYMNLASASAAAGRLTDAAAAACHAIAEDPHNPSPRQFLADLRSAALATHVSLAGCPAR